ncbi:DUF302 domain-containing protein [Flavobacteriaceae bacterium R38]|nr:DUF302 domain-containing protein [Flavobacteriaceae bacterium R38]
MKKFFIISFMAILQFACNNKEKMNSIDHNQLISIQNESNVEELASQLKEQIENKGFKVIADVNHAASATKVELELRPTRTLIFGNPQGGTKLMQQDQAIGLDLPLKILIWEDEEGKTNLSYYDGTTLTSRYGITEPQAVIEKVNGALAGFSNKPEEIKTSAISSVKDQLISKKSTFDTDTTFARLKEIVASKGLNIIAEVPHDKAAASVGLELRPTRLLIFGNPKVGTLLMQSDQKIGIDLPLKVLVHENEQGETYVSYFNASFLANRYEIADKDEVVTKINGALDGITNAVVTE